MGSWDHCEDDCRKIVMIPMMSWSLMCRCVSIETTMAMSRMCCTRLYPSIKGLMTPSVAGGTDSNSCPLDRADKNVTCAVRTLVVLDLDPGDSWNYQRVSVICNMFIMCDCTIAWLVTRPAMFFLPLWCTINLALTSIIPFLFGRIVCDCSDLLV